jgi:maleylpyruvate isomerase
MITLHGYWRSSAAYRVRIALNVKGVGFSQATRDLRRGEQRDRAYLSLAPQGLVPALDADGLILIQSSAIMEWLEETYPSPALLPDSATDRAQVRAMAALVSCDIHPLNNLRVLSQLKSQFAADEAQVQAWIRHWVEEGFAALETLIARHGGAYAFGDSLTLADCCLVPQVYSAERFKVPLAPYPNIRRVADAAMALEPVAAAHPSWQPDADPPA